MAVEQTEEIKHNKKGLLGRRLFYFVKFCELAEHTIETKAVLQRVDKRRDEYICNENNDIHRKTDP